MPRLCFCLDGRSNLSATPSKASRRNFSTIGAFCLSAFDGGGPRSTARRSRARVLSGDTASGVRVFCNGTGSRDIEPAAYRKWPMFPQLVRFTDLGLLLIRLMLAL